MTRTLTCQTSCVVAMRRLKRFTPTSMSAPIISAVSISWRARAQRLALCFVTSLLCLALPPRGVPRDSCLLSASPHSADVSLLTLLREQAAFDRGFIRAAQPRVAPSSPPPGSGLRQVFNLTSRHGAAGSGADFRAERTPPPPAVCTGIGRFVMTRDIEMCNRGFHT